MSAEIILLNREDAATKARATSDAAKIEARRIVADHINGNGFIDRPSSLVDAIAGAIRRAAVGTL